MIKNKDKEYFSRDSEISSVIKEVIAAIPNKTKAFMVGGAARNVIYYEFFKKSLPQKDFDIIVFGDIESFIKNIRSFGFVYGKSRKKTHCILRKKIRNNESTYYIKLDIFKALEGGPLVNLEKVAGFTINGFAIPLEKYLTHNVLKHTISLPGAITDLRKKQLHLNLLGYKTFPGNIFSALRFMSIGFKKPSKKEVMLLLAELPNIKEKWFERNINKVFDYTDGENNARELVKKLDIKIDLFDKNSIMEMKNVD